ncbi:hypothetical protein ACUOG2_26435, partial [Escherichia coli]
STNDLIDYAKFGQMIGETSVLQSEGGNLFTRIPVPSASRYFVGFMPSHSLLDGLSFLYTIYPSGAPDYVAKPLPPYHVEMASLSLRFLKRESG